MVRREGWLLEFAERIVGQDWYGRELDGASYREVEFADVEFTDVDFTEVRSRGSVFDRCVPPVSVQRFGAHGQRVPQR